MNGSPNDLERDKLEQLIAQLLSNVSSYLADTIRLGAIPRWLDHNVVTVLFTETETPSSVLNTLRRLHFVTEISPGQLTYHDQIRAYLIEDWLTTNPTRFRELSQQLQRHFLKRSGQPDEMPQAILPEWIYHLLAVNPAVGIFQLNQLFDYLLEAHELGFAERLAVVAEERRPLLGEQIAWLDYYPARLALARYDFSKASATLSTLAQNGHDVVLTATSQRAFGQTLLRQKQWTKSLTQLRKSLQTFQSLGDEGNIVRTLIALGDVYQDLADNSGGIFVEQRKFTSWLSYVIYIIIYLPLFLYGQLAQRLDFLPHLFGSNYQNWIVVRLLRLSAKAYGQAVKISSKLGDERLSVDIRQRLADLKLHLGYSRQAKQIYQTLLETPLVQSSSYQTARARFGLAQTALQLGAPISAREHFEASLETFRRFEDWRRVGKVAYQLGQLAETEERVSDAVEIYTLGIIATTRSKEQILRTDIAHTLRKLIVNNNTQSAINQTQRDQAEAALGQIDELAYIARFPGRIQSWFTWLTSFLLLLGGPLWILGALIMVVLVAISSIIIEGETLIAISDAPTPPTLINAIVLTLVALMPLFTLWIFNGLYALLGLLIVRFLLPIARVEESQPEMYILDHISLAKYDGMGRLTTKMAWDQIDSVIVVDRCLWRNPSALFSKTMLTAAKGPMTISISGTTNRYREFQQTIETYRNRHQIDSSPAKQCGLSLINHWWSWLALGLALVLGTILVFGFGVYSLYCATPFVDGECPEPIHLSFAPWVAWSNIFFILLFVVGSAIRLAYSWICARKYLRQAAGI